jgi:large subunit ribosomal protein L22
MMQGTAELNNYRQSPRKVRLVANAVRGKKVAEALTILDFMAKRSALPLKKLIASAHANAGKGESLVVKSLTVDQGPTLKRRMPRSRGMANPIKKRTSRVKVVVGEKAKK